VNLSIYNFTYSPGDVYMTTFQRLLGLVGVTSMVAYSLPIKAQLASQSTQFSGTVPPVCQVVDPVQASTPLSYQGNTLSGTTNAFSFESNGNVALQLRQVQIDSAPSGTGNYGWNAGLKVNNGEQLAQSTQNAPSSSVAYPNGLNSNDDFQMTLNISAPNNTLMNQGTYVATVTTDCIAP
jgi:hypothetical protein